MSLANFQKAEKSWRHNHQTTHGPSPKKEKQKFDSQQYKKTVESRTAELKEFDSFSSDVLPILTKIFSHYQPKPTFITFKLLFSGALSTSEEHRIWGYWNEMLMRKIHPMASILPILYYVSNSTSLENGFAIAEYLNQFNFLQTQNQMYTFSWIHLCFLQTLSVSTVPFRLQICSAPNPSLFKATILSRNFKGMQKNGRFLDFLRTNPKTCHSRCTSEWPHISNVAQESSSG